MLHNPKELVDPRTKRKGPYRGVVSFARADLEPGTPSDVAPGTPFHGWIAGGGVEWYGTLG